MGQAVRVKADKNEKLGVYIKGANKRGFTIQIPGPSSVSVVKLQSGRTEMSTNAKALADWYRDRGDETWNVNYPLTPNSLVLEVGCYEGLWSSRMASKYNCFIQNFEPVKSFFQTASNLFRDNPKVSMFNFGLTDSNLETEFALDEDKSRPGSEGRIEKVILRDVAEIITCPVSLININIEGGEYTLLPRMLSTPVASLCQNIQVQFHDDYPGCVELRDDIRAQLSKTHVETYCYPFVWESWRLK
jgi:FkbM family methyltransferase